MQTTFVNFSNATSHHINRQIGYIKLMKYISCDSYKFNVQIVNMKLIKQRTWFLCKYPLRIADMFSFFKDVNNYTYKDTDYNK